MYDIFAYHLVDFYGNCRQIYHGSFGMDGNPDGVRTHPQTRANIFNLKKGPFWKSEKSSKPKPSILGVGNPLISFRGAGGCLYKKSYQEIGENWFIDCFTSTAYSLLCMFFPGKGFWAAHLPQSLLLYTLEN